MCIFALLYALATSLICLFDDNENSIIPFVSLLIMILSLVYVIMANNKQYEILEGKYKYVIKVIRGKGFDIYYTNQYEIENGIIYFDGNCANNFTVEIN